MVEVSVNSGVWGGGGGASKIKRVFQIMKEAIWYDKGLSLCGVSCQISKVSHMLRCGITHWVNDALVHGIGVSVNSGVLFQVVLGGEGGGGGSWVCSSSPPPTTKEKVTMTPSFRTKFSPTVLDPFTVAPRKWRSVIICPPIALCPPPPSAEDSWVYATEC